MNKEKIPFKAEVQQLLHLMIHSLYSRKEIFLRELISNASDALDKFRFLALTQKELQKENNVELYIRVEADKENQTLKVIDNGIGMSLKEVKENLGTIAQSGTRKFLELQKNKAAGSARAGGVESASRGIMGTDFIGQFGVGFYSAFMAAHRVVVHTQKAGSKTGVLWEAQQDSSYTLNEVPRPQGRGTTVTLYLKKDLKDASEKASEDSQDFTSFFVLQSLVRKYSDFITYPIKMLKEKETPVKDKTPQGQAAPSQEQQQSMEDVTLNTQKALWLKEAKEVTEEENRTFYRHLSGDWQDPLHTLHFRAEGQREFTALLYIPQNRPWDYYNKETKFGPHLYIRRVFILQDGVDLIPSCLRFVKGVVDSADLSLNVSREMLQEDTQVHFIRKTIANKMFKTLKELLQKDRKKYELFWESFGATLKEGMVNEPSYSDNLQELLLFFSTHMGGEGSERRFTSLQEYRKRMPENQKAIYYMTGENLYKMKESPYLEKLKEKGFEVLFLVDPIDEWVVGNLKEYDKIPLQSITHENLDLRESTLAKSPEDKTSQDKDKDKGQGKGQETEKEEENKLQLFLRKMKGFLKEEVQEVKVSHRLIQSPVCLVASTQSPSAHMQKILAQMNRSGHPLSSTEKRILEVNPKHPLIHKMLTLPEDRQKQWAYLLFHQALLIEGSTPNKPAEFARTLNEILLESS